MAPLVYTLPRLGLLPVCLYGRENAQKAPASPYPLNLRGELLGGHFGPEKKYSAPPLKNPQFAADTLPAPRPLLDPPPLGF